MRRDADPRRRCRRRRRSCRVRHCARSCAHREAARRAGQRGDDLRRAERSADSRGGARAQKHAEASDACDDLACLPSIASPETTRDFTEVATPLKRLARRGMRDEPIVAWTCFHPLSRARKPSRMRTSGYNIGRKTRTQGDDPQGPACRLKRPCPVVRRWPPPCPRSRTGTPRSWPAVPGRVAWRRMAGALARLESRGAKRKRRLAGERRLTGKKIAMVTQLSRKVRIRARTGCLVPACTALERLLLEVGDRRQAAAARRTSRSADDSTRQERTNTHMSQTWMRYPSLASNMRSLRKPATPCASMQLRRKNTGSADRSFEQRQPAQTHSRSISPKRRPPSRERPSTGWRVRICTGPRARAWILSPTMCLRRW